MPLFDLTYCRSFSSRNAHSAHSTGIVCSSMDTVASSTASSSTATASSSDSSSSSTSSSSSRNSNFIGMCDFIALVDTESLLGLVLNPLIWNRSVRECSALYWIYYLVLC